MEQTDRQTDRRADRHETVAHIYRYGRVQRKQSGRSLEFVTKRRAVNGRVIIRVAVHKTTLCRVMPGDRREFDGPAAVDPAVYRRVKCVCVLNTPT